MLKLLYFARLREALGLASEEVPLPAGVENVAGLREWLRHRGDKWAAELASNAQVRVAVNQDMANHDTAIMDGDEVAFFPPVTGG